MKKIFSLTFVAFAFLFFLSGTAKAAEPACTGKNGTDPGATGLVPCGVSQIYAFSCTYVSGLSEENRSHYIFATTRESCQDQCDAYKPDGTKISATANFMTYPGGASDCICQVKANYWLYKAKTIESFSSQEAQKQCDISGTDRTDKDFANAPRVPVKKIGNTLACPCEPRHIFVMVVNVFSFLILYIAFPLAALMVVIGGIMYIVSRGNPGLAEKAKSILKISLLGLALIVGSYLIIDVVLKAIGYVLPWYTF